MPGTARVPRQDERHAELREQLLARARAATDWAATDWAATDWAAQCQDDALASLADRELEALGIDELWGLTPDPSCAPPDGEEAWLADLPGPLLAEYLAAIEEPPGPEPIPAGKLCRETGDGCGFAAGGVADNLPPGTVLAGFAGDAWAAGLGRLNDDELIGVLRAARRLASWSAAMELAAVADLARRRTSAPEANGHGSVGDHISEEIAVALTLTGRAADALLDFALVLDRLPATMAALADGRIDRCKAAVIADEVTGLSRDHAAAVEQQVLDRAPGQTSGQLRASTRRAVLAADPAAARERKEQAQRDARVEKWDEHAGTAALAGRDLPPAQVLAADHNLSALARQLKRAGVDGTMDQLRAEVYLALLTGQPISTLLPPAAGAPASAPTPGLRGSVNLTVPLLTWLGLSGDPGHVAGFGPLDAGDSRDLAALLAGQPGNRWCVTLTGTDGRPVGHGCARTGPRLTLPARPGPPHGPAPPGDPPAHGPAPPGNLPPHGPAPPGDPPPHGQPHGPAPPGDHPSRGPAPPDHLSWLAAIPIGRLETGDCGHERESAAYQPAPSLRHLITVRQPACSFPGCRRPARQCDQDHTIPFAEGGRTCECNLAPLCRRHHQAKQAQGWTLAQPQPGTMIWTTPSGRTYATGPASYCG